MPDPLFNMVLANVCRAQLVLMSVPNPAFSTKVFKFLLTNLVKILTAKPGRCLTPKAFRPVVRVHLSRRIYLTKNNFSKENKLFQVTELNSNKKSLRISGRISQYQDLSFRMSGYTHLDFFLQVVHTFFKLAVGIH